MVLPLEAPSRAPSSWGCLGGAQAQPQAGQPLGTTCCLATLPSAFGSASLGWNNHAPANLSETQVVATEFPISKQLRV